MRRSPLAAGPCRGVNVAHREAQQTLFTGVRGRGQPVEKPLTRSLRPQIGYQTRQFWRVTGSLCGRYQLGPTFSTGWGILRSWTSALRRSEKSVLPRSATEGLGRLGFATTRIPPVQGGVGGT